jgi:hypothetical protein
MHHKPSAYRLTRTLLTSLMLLGVLFSTIGQFRPVQAEGSMNLYPTTSANRRALTEWRTDTTVNFYRRTFFRVYAQAGEYILMGSSAMNLVSSLGGGRTGDIVLYQEGLISNSQIDPVTLAGITKTFTCRTAGGGLTTGGNLGVLRGASKWVKRRIYPVCLSGPHNGHLLGRHVRPRWRWRQPRWRWRNDRSPDHHQCPE